MLDEPFELSRFIAKERKGKWPSCVTLAPACTALFDEPTVEYSGPFRATLKISPNDRIETQPHGLRLPVDIYT